MISAVEALKEAYTPGNRAIKFFARLRRIDVIELACKFLAMPLLKNSRHELSRVSAGMVTVHIMTVKLGMVVFLGLFAAHSPSAQAAQPPKTSARIIGSFFIDPTWTSIKGGKASLMVGALRRNAGTYVGDYELTVSPYFFMSEKGTLSMIVSDESLRKLTQGIPVSVTGQATTKKSGKTRAVNAKLTPAVKERGSVTFSFTEMDTKLIFNTSYQFGNN